jgi:hypothetical protein
MSSRIEGLKYHLLSFSLWLAVFSSGIALIIVVNNSPGMPVGSVSGDNGQRIQRIENAGSRYIRKSRFSGKATRSAKHATRRNSYSRSRSTHSVYPNEALMANDVPTAVLGQTKNLRTRQSMLLGSDLEGGWESPFPVGDNGTSFGPYQMHEGGALTALGLTSTQAENARTATKAMMPTYENAVNQISDHLWQTNPESAAEQAAVIAERPAQTYYASRGSGVVNAAWQNTSAVLAGKKSTGGMPTNAVLTSAGENPLTIAGDLLTGNVSGLLGATGFKSVLERIGLVIFGAVLVIIGIVILALPAAKQAATTAASIRRGGNALGMASGAAAEDSARRQAIATQANEIGVRKVALQEQREARLARSSAINAPAKGRHAAG